MRERRSCSTRRTRRARRSPLTSWPSIPMVTRCSLTSYARPQPARWPPALWSWQGHISRASWPSRRRSGSAPACCVSGAGRGVAAPAASGGAPSGGARSGGRQGERVQIARELAVSLLHGGHVQGAVAVLERSVDELGDTDRELSLELEADRSTAGRAPELRPGALRARAGSATPACRQDVRRASRAGRRGRRGGRGRRDGRRGDRLRPAGAR